jgi:hypothetical protein
MAKAGPSMHEPMPENILAKPLSHEFIMLKISVSIK